jgi:Holliday junction DNA helicase RuvA
MIDYINGRLADLTPAYAVVEAGGVGYGLCISLNTYAAIQNSKEIKLFVYESIREDAYTLYGFATKQERTLFVQLIAVSGVGGNTARMILSTFSPAELCNTISTSNDKLLKTVKGVGLKTAQRIIVELHDKIDMEGIEPQSGETASATEVNSKIRNEAVSALTMLGFPPAPTHKVVSAILSEQPDIPVEQVIKIALKRL